MEELSIFNRVKRKSIYSLLGFCKNNPIIEKLSFKHRKLVKFNARFFYNQFSQFANDSLTGLNTVFNFYSKALSAVFIVTETGVVFKLDLYSNKLELLLNTHLEKVVSIALMKNKYLLLASGSDKKRGCHMYDIRSRSFKFNFTGYYGETTCIQKLSSTLFASGSSRKTIKIWNTDNQSLVSILRHHKDAILYLARTSKESLLSHSKDKTLKIWGLRNYECVKTIELGFTTLYISLLTKNEIILYSSAYSFVSYESGVSNNCYVNIATGDKRNHIFSITFVVKLTSKLAVFIIKPNKLLFVSTKDKAELVSHFIENPLGSQIISVFKFSRNSLIILSNKQGNIITLLRNQSLSGEIKYTVQVESHDYEKYIPFLIMDKNVDYARLTNSELTFISAKNPLTKVKTFKLSLRNIIDNLIFFGNFFIYNDGNQVWKYDIRTELAQQVSFNNQAVKSIKKINDGKFAIASRISISICSAITLKLLLHIIPYKYIHSSTQEIETFCFFSHFIAIGLSKGSIVILDLLSSSFTYGYKVIEVGPSYSFKTESLFAFNEKLISFSKGILAITNTKTHLNIFFDFETEQRNNDPFNMSHNSMDFKNPTSHFGSVGSSDTSSKSIDKFIDPAFIEEKDLIIVKSNSTDDILVISATSATKVKSFKSHANAIFLYASKNETSNVIFSFCNRYMKEWDLNKGTLLRQLDLSKEIHNAPVKYFSYHPYDKVATKKSSRKFKGETQYIFK